MPFDVDLARRVRQHLAATSGVTEKGMFGGTAFFVGGNLCVGVIRDDLVARVGPERFPEAMERVGSRPFTMTGRPLSGWVVVAPAACADDRVLAGWIDEALEYVVTLPNA
ncbi:MAG TPA: TfoX/Sxy family protein [Candidatus Dormibacteraeota bacterium]|jgi:TfoX/Sxy family transcriptional regulator of competence genes